jgi:hypothetical protein
MKDIKLTCLIIVTVFNLSCKTKHVRAKFINESKYDFNGFIAELGDETIKIDKIKSGQETEYYEVNETWTLINVKAIIDGDTVKLPRLCYTGEKLLKRGKVKFTVKVYEDESTGKKWMMANGRRIY